MQVLRAVGEALLGRHLERRRRELCERLALRRAVREVVRVAAEPQQQHVQHALAHHRRRARLLRGAARLSVPMWP